MTASTVEEQLGRLARGADHVVRLEELRARLEEGRPLRVKFGVDPTARDITLGWAVPLQKLRQVQDAGHIAVLIVGDFTARIGDPSGRSTTRPRLSPEQVRANAQGVLEQLGDVLSSDNLEVRYNAEWLEPLDLGDVLGLSAHCTVAQLLERNDFQDRYRAQVPISLSEFLYPVAQGYDSIAIESDVELGGSDQLFNFLLARDLQRAFGQRPQVAVTMPLLVGLDGVQKMSQSVNNYVGIREPPVEMFGKLMSIPDELVSQYAGLAAWLDPEGVAEVTDAAAAGGPPAARAKRRVANAVVGRYHGQEAAAAAEAAFDRQFKEGQAPEVVAEASIPADAVDGDVVYLPRVLAQLGLASSRGEARRLIAQGGVRMNGEPVSSEEVRRADLERALLQVGRRRFVRLTP